MRRSGLTQPEAAKRMGITHAELFGMMHGELLNLFACKLKDCLTRLGYDIEIKVHPAQGGLYSMRNL